jgi:2-polyprenyl-3-methyl-5-hydroxy-6-metoxy-1,4-benzoquinol methylase
MNCRHCASPLTQKFLDLGFAPPSNAYLNDADLKIPELYFPLRIFVCEHCWLVQTEDYARSGELFRSDYAYFSSVSKTWLEHAARYAEKAIARFDLNAESFVIEVAANDGYLLRNFVAAGIPCLGVEPTDSTAAVAEQAGVPIVRKFFSAALADELVREGRKADLIVANNVYAHVPDINDFTRGLKTVLKPQGVITLEFPHIMRLIESNQFDTVYHEHFSYLSLHTVARIFAEAGLRVWDVEELPTHGGSLRVYGCHADDQRADTAAAAGLLAMEELNGLYRLSTYAGFQSRADRVKDELLAFLIARKQSGKSVAAYGAAAKGNTLLNYAGVKPDLLPYVCDAAPSKQGKLLPGSHIPVMHPDVLRERRPDVVLILPWNIAGEVVNQIPFVGDWGGEFWIAVPSLRKFA